MGFYESELSSDGSRSLQICLDFYGRLKIFVIQFFEIISLYILVTNTNILYLVF